ncbi:uncharacterized protein LOC135483766 [Lineus longissimus]|uniref:uncharacterized protein LOC135483766 n=1 Tax=Lineus longissimus TaxID=88925 RepID=UPI002B4DE648
MMLQKTIGVMSGVRGRRLVSPLCLSLWTRKQVCPRRFFWQNGLVIASGRRLLCKTGSEVHFLKEESTSCNSSKIHMIQGNESESLSTVSVQCTVQKGCYPIHSVPKEGFRKVTESQLSFHRHFCQKASPSDKLERRQKSLDIPTPPESDYHYDEDMSFFHINGYNVYPWSISGLGTSVIVNRDNMTVAFDIGYASREAFCSQYVFISHGHTDHTMGLTSHASKREMNGMVPATYYVPDHLMQPLTTIVKQFSLMEGGASLRSIDIRSCSPGQTIKLPWDRFAIPFPTYHRVPSQGYIVYHEKKQLKHEYEDMMSYERVLMKKKGVELYDTHVEPEIAYTGDTTFDVFLNPPTPDLLNVKLLITECTFVDEDADRRGRSSIAKAESVGHIHLKQFCEHAHLFDNVEGILLIHFSDKYTVQYIRDRVFELVPESLRNKIYLGLTAQELYLGLGVQEDS